MAPLSFTGIVSAGLNPHVPGISERKIHVYFAFSQKAFRFAMGPCGGLYSFRSEVYNSANPESLRPKVAFAQEADSATSSPGSPGGKWEWGPSGTARSQQPELVRGRVEPASPPGASQKRISAERPRGKSAHEVHAPRGHSQVLPGRVAVCHILM